MKPAVKKLWLKALRSGKYKQAKNVLKSSNGGFCCLGVLCDLHAKETGEGYWTGGKNKHAGVYHDTKTVDGYKVNDKTELTPAVMKWAGLEFSNPQCGKIDGFERSLAEYNDVLKYNFKKIASLIEKNL